jgi:hypothetical protein
MITVDIAADLNDEDETGFVWAYLDDARDPDLIRPGNVVIAGMPTLLQCARSLIL